MVTKNFMTLENLTTYDGLIKQYIADGDADSIKAVALDNNILKFYDVETPTAQTQPKYSIELPNPDMSDLMHKIANANGDKVVVSNSDGSVSEGSIDADDIAILPGSDFVEGRIVVIGTSEGSLSESSFEIGARNNQDYAVITGYSIGGKGSLLMVDDGEVDVTQAIDSNGNPITVSDLVTNAFVGSIPAGSSATTVVGYVDEVAGSITSASDVTLVEAQTPTTGYLKTYELYQGGNAAANLVGKIDIPKDLVVTSGEIVVNPSGQPAGTYLKLTIANQTTPVYINVADLCDAYTAASGATQVQLAISNTNEISATLVAGGVGTTELASSAVTTAKIADDAVTAAKVNISAHSETDTGVAIDSNDDTSYNIITVEVETTDGQVSNVDVTVNDLESFVSAKIGYEVPNMIIDNINALDATVSQSAGNDGLALQVVEADGVLTSVTGSIAANTYDSYGAASTVQSTVVGVLGDAPTASTIYGAKAYADSATAAISTADINALFSSNSNS